MIHWLTSNHVGLQGAICSSVHLSSPTGVHHWNSAGNKIHISGLATVNCTDICLLCSCVFVSSAELLSQDLQVQLSLPTTTLQKACPTTHEVRKNGPYKTSSVVSHKLGWLLFFVVVVFRDFMIVFLCIQSNPTMRASKVFFVHLFICLLQSAPSGDHNCSAPGNRSNTGGPGYWKLHWHLSLM